MYLGAYDVNNVIFRRYLVKVDLIFSWWNDGSDDDIKMMMLMMKYATMKR